MSALEINPGREELGPEPVTVVLRLDAEAAKLLAELMQRTGDGSSDVVSWALGAYWREVEGIVLPPPMPPEEADAAVAEGEAAFERGDYVEQGAMFERLRQKYGE